MFLLTNKALIRVGKGAKRKAHHHHDVGYTGERQSIFRLRDTPVKQETRGGIEM